MYVFIEVLRGGCVPAAHKVDVVWPSLTGRMLHRELNFLKCPPSSPVRLIWQLTECVCVCVQVCVCAYAIFPALFPAYLPCRGSQSPLTGLFLSRWSDLNVWVFVPVLTRLHTASFFCQQKDVLSRLGDSMETHNSWLTGSVCRTTYHLVFTWSPPGCGDREPRGICLRTAQLRNTHNF